MSASGQKVIALYPVPTVPGALANNFIGHGVLNSDTDQFDVRSVITSAAEKRS